MNAVNNGFQVMPNGNAPALTISKKLNNGLTKEEIETLVQAGVIPADCPPAQIKIFAQVCKETRLSPFRKQAAIIGFFSKAKNCNIYSIIITNEGLRTLVNRTGCYAGCEPTTFNNNLSWFQMQDQIDKESITALKTCTFTAYFLDSRGNKNKYTKTISFKEFYNPNNSKYNQMPLQMAEKVAKSFTYKEMLGDEIAGFVVAEELDAMNDAQLGQVPLEPTDDVLDGEAKSIALSATTRQELQAAITEFKMKHKISSLEYAPKIYEIFNSRFKELSK